jgi:hypothetical protein
MKKRQQPAKAQARKRRAKQQAERPRTFEEVCAANLADPFHAARIVCGFVHPDCEGGSHWLVEWGDSDGPMAEQRARDYFVALKSRRLKVLREIE